MSIEFKRCAGDRLTVGELRSWLGKIPSDAIVATEGCDCEDVAIAIRITTARVPYSTEQGVSEVMIARFVP